MNVPFVRRLASICMVILFTTLLAACGSTSASTTTSTPTVTAITPTPAPTATATGPTFQDYTGPGFTLKYPAGWTAGNNLDNTGKNVYSFMYSDNITGFHIKLHTSFVDASSPIAVLTGASMNCTPNDTSLPQTVTINGTKWGQSDLLCMLASTYYEVRMLITEDAPLGQQTTIVYGAYQQAVTSPPFQQANQKYFEPMLQSVKLTNA